MRGVLTGIPMLSALESAACVGESADAAVIAVVQAIKQVVAHTWMSIGKTWSCPEVVEIAEKVS